MAAKLMLALFLLAAPAVAETRAPYGGRAVASLTSAPAALDPLAAQSYAEVTLAGLLFDTLYRLDAQGRPVPHLAETLPELASDGLTARIRLRAGVRFQDGRPLRIGDVIASLGRAAGHWALAPVKRVGRDGEVLVLGLARPTAELAVLLSVPQLSITPAGKAPPARAPVGSGPFRLRRVEPRRLELEAFAEHAAGRPHLDALVLRWFEAPEDEARAYEAGEADVSLRGAVAFAGHQPKYPTAPVDGPATVLVYVGFGRGHGNALADPRLRQGISLALNRAALRHVGTGERVLPATAPESTDLGGQAAAPADTAPHPEEAARALARLSGTPLVLIVDRSRPDDPEVAQRVVTALDRAGLAISYLALEPREFARRVAAGQCDLHVGQLVAPTGDPTHEIAAAFAAGGDRWAAARLAAAPLGREAALAAFAQRLPIVPLYHRAVRAHHRTTVRGLAFDALGRPGWADAFLFPDGVGDSP